MLYQGRYWNIDLACRINGRKPAKKFLENLDEKEQLKFGTLFRDVADEPRYSNGQKFKKLKGNSNIWQFTSGDYRIFAHQLNNTYFLTNGFLKKRNETERRHIKSAKNIEKEDLERRSEK